MKLKKGRDDNSDSNAGKNPAADLIRQKIDQLYDSEPSAIEEQKEIESSGTHSKHQKFIAELSASDESLASIQQTCHEYYQSLPENEKHQVWQEYYEQHSRAKKLAKQKEIEAISLSENPKSASHKHDESAESMADLKHKVLNKVNAGGKLKAKHHVKSIVFALSFASFITLVLFFITNNQRFITPFIQPSQKVAAAPFITDGSSVGPETKIIIPKLNLEANIVIEDFDPADYNATWDILEKGVVMYPNTGVPGEKDRNPVFFGHSSNNIFNHGVAKFVFVRLHELEIGDTYAINYKGTQYVYKVFGRYVVDKTAVEYLDKLPAEYGKVAMSTLITCDPPGTGYKRLILQGEQISPNPSENAAPKALTQNTSTPAEVPSNAPSLLERLFNW